MLVKLRSNELIHQLLGSTTTARSLFPERRVFQSSRKTVALSNTRQVVGSFPKLALQITFTDKKGMGKLKLKGTWDLNFYQLDQIKRVRLVRRADGYYVQFLISADNKVESEPTGKTVGLDVGLKEFYTD